MAPPGSARRIRVLEVTSSYPRYKGDFPGIFNFRLDRELAKRGHEVFVLAPGTPDYPHEEVIDGVKVKRVTYFWPNRLQLLAYGTGIKINILKYPWRIILIPLLFTSLLLHTLYYGRRYDIIHCHWAPMGLLGLIARPFVGRPVVLTLGGTDYRNLPVFFVKYIIEHADAVVAVATETEEYLRGLGFTEYEVIRTLVNEDEFNPEAISEDITGEFNVKGDRIISFIGRLYPFKGPEQLLDAVPLVLEKRKDVKFFIIGEGVLMATLIKKALDLNVKGFVIFTGQRTDVARFLAASDVFTALSPVENTWSNTIAEAMFMGTPLVLTDAGHTREFFTHERDCMLVPPRDPQALAEAICYLLDNPEVCERLVEGAYELLDRSGKRREKIVADTISLYRRLAGIN